MLPGDTQGRRGGGGGSVLGLTGSLKPSLKLKSTPVRSGRELSPSSCRVGRGGGGVGGGQNKLDAKRASGESHEEAAQVWGGCRETIEAPAAAEAAAAATLSRLSTSGSRVDHEGIIPTCFQGGGC